MTSDIDRMRLTSMLIKALIVAVGIFLMAILFIPKSDKARAKKDTASGIKYSKRMIITTKECGLCGVAEVDTAFLPIVYGEDSSTVYQSTDGICHSCYVKNKERADALLEEGIGFLRSGNYADARYYLKQSMDLGHPKAKAYMDSIQVRITRDSQREILSTEVDLDGVDSDDKNELISKLQAAMQNQGWNTSIELSGEDRSVITIYSDEMDEEWANNFYKSEYMNHVKKGEFKQLYFKNSSGSFQAHIDF